MAKQSAVVVVVFEDPAGAPLVVYPSLHVHDVDVLFSPVEEFVPHLVHVVPLMKYVALHDVYVFKLSHVYPAANALPAKIKPKNIAKTRKNLDILPTFFFFYTLIIEKIIISAQAKKSQINKKFFLTGILVLDFFEKRTFLQHNNSKNHHTK